MLQEVLEAANPRGRFKLVKGLQGHVTEAWECPNAAPHANHVLQRCIEALPPADCAFVLEEMLSSGIERASSNKYGCRIVQRLIEHFPHEVMEPLFKEILDPDTLQKLAVSRFGNFVVQCILEHGSSEQRKCIVSALLHQDDQKFTRLAENMYASHVVQQAMKRCSPEHQRLLVQRIISIEQKDPKFKRSVYGSFVAHEAKNWIKAHPLVEARARAQSRGRRGRRPAPGGAREVFDEGLPRVMPNFQGKSASAAVASPSAPSQQQASRRSGRRAARAQAEPRRTQ